VSLSMLIYETGFSYLKMGQAAAISVVLFAIMLVFTAFQISLFARSEQSICDGNRSTPQHRRVMQTV